MSGAQKVIKVFAVALAVVITASIVSAIAGAGMLVSFIFEGWQKQDEKFVSVEQEVVIGEEYEGINEVRLDVDNVNVRIESGSKLSVESTSSNVKIHRSGNRLDIKQDDWHFFGDWSDENVVIVVPDDLRKLEMTTGVGRTVIDGVTMEELSLKLGVGQSEMRGVEVTRRTKIESGAGSLLIERAKLKNLDFDMGVGKVRLMAALDGDSDIDAGLGALDLVLVGEEDDYRVVVDEGLGAVNWNGLRSGNVKGEHFVKIDGGVGAINIGLVAE